MYAWYRPGHEGSTPPGMHEVTVRFEESPVLFQRLLDDAVRARLLQLGFTAKSGGFVNYGRPGLLTPVPALASVTEHTGAAIDNYPKVLYDVFFTRDASSRVIMGLIVDVLYTTRMDITAAEWVATGIGDRLRGKYVSLLSDAPEAKDFPYLVGRAVGRVDGIRGDQCLLTDLRDKALPAARVTSIAPEPTRANLAAYLMACYERAFTAGGATSLRSCVSWSGRRLGSIMQKESYTLVCSHVRDRRRTDSFCVVRSGLSSRRTARSGDGTFPAQRLPDPEYSFDPVERKYATRVDAGLRKHGPYDRQRRRRQAARLLVVAPAENKGDVTLAMQKLLGGVQMDRPVFDGLKPMYRLDQLEVTYAWAEQGADAPMTRYARAYQQALQNAPPPAAGEPRFHLVLAVIRAAHRDLPDSENPYFQIEVTSTCQRPRAHADDHAREAPRQ